MDSSGLNSPRSQISAKWMQHRARGGGAWRYIIKVMALALICILLGYSASNLYAYNEHQQWQSTPFRGSYTTLEADAEKGTMPENSKDYLDRPSRRLSKVGPGDQLHQDVVGSEPSTYLEWSDKLSHLTWWGKGSNSKTTSGDNPTDHKLAEKEAPKASHLTETKEEVSTPPPTYGGNPVVGKVTIVTGDENSIYERALKTHEAHNRIHSYPFHTLRQSILNDVWSKPAYILSILLRELARPKSERLQWLLWVDADTIILNPHIPAEVFLPPVGWEDIHLLVSHDFNGLNNGVFPIRVHPWSVDLLTAVLAYPFYRPERHLTFRDQSAMEEVLKSRRFAKHTLQAPQRWFNAYQGELNETLAPFQTRRGDLLVHFAGVGNRDERMELWLQRAEEHSEEWEVELKYTSYKSEVKLFWEEMDRKRKAAKEELEKVRKAAQDYREWVESVLEVYKDRLGETEQARVLRAIETLKRVMQDEEWKDDTENIRGKSEVLRKVAEPLETMVGKAHKVLLKEAHELIFKAENETLTNFASPDTENEVREIEELVSKLKDLLLTKPIKSETIREAMDVLRGKDMSLQAKIEALAAEKQALEQKAAEEAAHQAAEQAAEQASGQAAGQVAAAAAEAEHSRESAVQEAKTVGAEDQAGAQEEQPAKEEKAVVETAEAEEASTGVVTLARIKRSRN